MPFDGGSVSFMMCKLPEPMPEDALTKFSDKKAMPLSNVGDEPDLGWVSGRHLLETRIDEETSICGGYLTLSLRVAQRKIPSSLFKAECKIEELALQAATNSFFVSRKAKKEIQEAVTEKLLETMPPNLSGIPFVVDERSQILYLGCSSAAQYDRFALFFHETMGFEPIALNAYEAAMALTGEDPRDLPGLHFSPERASFDQELTLGRDFCTWLWYFQEMQGGQFRVVDRGDFAIQIDGPLSFASEGDGAMESVVRKGAPTLSAEAKAALLVGKKLRQAKFNMVRDKEIWSFGFDADTFVFRSMKMPQGEELDPQSHFQERVMSLTIFREAFFALYELFLDNLRDTKRWEALQPAIYEWVNELEGK